MSLFAKKPATRPVTEIVSGLTAIVTELEDSIAVNEAEKTATAEDRDAEIARHEAAIEALSIKDSNLDNELSTASTVKDNLSNLLGISE